MADQDPAAGAPAAPDSAAPAPAAASPAPAAPAAPAPAPAPAPAGDPAPVGDPPAAKGYWPDDWQSRLAGEDKDALKQLGRYASPEDIWKKARALEKKLSSGEVKAVLPKDPKPEEITAWRKENGIPEAPEKYDLGLKIPKEDTELVGTFLKSAHAANFTPAQAKAGVEAYYEIRKAQVEAAVARDHEQRQSTLDALNEEWGPQFRRNVNIIEGTILAKFPESVRDLVKNARLPDGTALFNSVDAVKGLAALALELNPAGIVAPASGADIGKSAIEEYQEIQKQMRTNRAEYNRDAAKQERFKVLIDYLTKNDLIDATGEVRVQQRKAA